MDAMAVKSDTITVFPEIHAAFHPDIVGRMSAPAREFCKQYKYYRRELHFSGILMMAGIPILCHPGNINSVI